MQPWVWLLIIIAVIMVVWWLMSRSAEGEPDFEVHHEEESSSEEHEAAPTEEEAAPAPPDDLVSLEGIGPKVQTLLGEAGINTFSDLASTGTDRLEEILEANGLQFMDPASWPEQAKLASEGKLDELQALQDQLKGGREA